MAYIKKKSERKFKITVCNGYKVNGQKRMKAQTITVPSYVPKRGIQQYVMAEAERIEKKFKYGIEESDQTHFEQYAENWLKRQEPFFKATTYAGYKRNLDIVYPLIGGIPLAKLLPMTLEEMCEELRKRPGRGGNRIKETTVQKYLETVSSVLEDAKKNDIIPFNPAHRVRKKHFEKEVQHIPQKYEMGKLMRTIQNEPILYRAYYTLAITTGLRRGELCALQWRDITGACELTVRRSRSCASGQIVESDTKSHRERIVTIPMGIWELLMALRQQQMLHSGVLDREQPIFTDPDDHVPHPDTFTRHLRKLYTPKQAEKWVKEQAILFEREVQHTPEPINRSITLAKYIEHWVADVGPKKLADSTYQRDLQDIRRILPALGNYKLTDLRKEVIREFYEEMRHSPRLDGRGYLSEKSVEGLHNTLCGVLSAAVDEGYLTHNPAWRCYKPKGQKKERPVADEETVKKLIAAFEGQSLKYETYFKLVLATGLRRGEACGLKWSDINWKKRTIHIQRGVVKLSHQESITKDPKTTSGDRMVYLSKEMCQLLKAWRKECEWDRAQTANETVDDNDYLFRQPNGKPMCPSTFTYRFKLILKANNLPLNLSVHSLRHTNASLMIAQGVDVRTVASLLGHAQASTTLDIYAHAFDKNKRKAQEKLGKAIGL